VGNVLVVAEQESAPSQLERPLGPDAFSVSLGKPPPRAAANACGLVHALAQLQRELEPLVADVLHGEGRTLLEALQAENAALRTRIQELEACIASKPVTHRLDASRVSCDEDLPPSTAPRLAGAASSLEPEPGPEDDNSEAPSEGILARLAQESATGTMARGESMDTGRSRESLALVDAPKRAFVINVRRLVEAQERFALLHELIQSTAMAALTLCSAGSQQQLRSTTCFLIFVIAIFFLHGHLWDTLDVSDLVMMLPVISDDNYKDTPNPNRLLKLLTFSQSNLPRYSAHLLDLLFASVCIFGWLLTVRAWDIGQGVNLQEGNEDNFVHTVSGFFVSEGADNDAEVLGMQVAIMTLMFVLHMLFKAAHYNETCAVMPATASGHFWDPRNHGVPWRYWLFGGMPSMWFTSEEVLQDLKHYIYKANLTSRVVRISPQEIAIYALSGMDELLATRRTLSEAVLFDGRDRRPIGDKLNIDLCFFDSKLHTRGCAHPGEFLTVTDEDDAEADAVRPSMGRPSTPTLTVGSSRKSSGSGLLN